MGLRTSTQVIAGVPHPITRKSLKNFMKNILIFVSSALLLACISTSCNKTGCHCYVKSDIMHLAPVYEDETSTKEECKAKESELNEEEGIDIIRCNQ